MCDASFRWHAQVMLQAVVHHGGIQRIPNIPRVSLRWQVDTGLASVHEWWTIAASSVSGATLSRWWHPGDTLGQKNTCRRSSSSGSIALQVKWRGIRDNRGLLRQGQEARTWDLKYSGSMAVLLKLTQRAWESRRRELSSLNTSQRAEQISKQTGSADIVTQ